MELFLILFMVCALVVIIVTNKLYLRSLRYSEMERQLAQLEDVDAEVIRRQEEAESYRRGVIKNVEAEVVRRRAEAEAGERIINARIANVKAEESAREAQRVAQRKQLDEDFQSTQKELQRMLREMARVEDKVGEIDVGLYRPHYALGGSADYQQKLSEVTSERANLFKTKRAIVILGEWKVATRAKDIQKLQSQLTKLMLRAFNGECTGPA